MPFTRHAALILVPVLLLAGIAVFGLVEYRHAITAEAREVATRWTEQSEPLFARLEAAVEALPQTILYDDLPQAADAASPAVDRLEKATAAGDAVALRGLLDSPGRTESGLPVRVLAAWRLLDLGGGISDAERLAGLAIHEAPSAISAPVVQALLERFPDPSGRTDWAGEWQSSEARRAVLAGDPDATGFVGTPDGPALLLGGKVLTAPELRSTATALVADQRTFLPEWMTLDLVARDTSLVSPIGDPFVAGGSPLRVDVGIGDPQALYARYWRLFWWAAALIACALGTTVTGIVLAARSLARERRLGELKSQFVASVSHELRTPVASIRLMADALDGGKVDGDTAMNFHRLMSQEGARLSSLIENVLDFARIEEGRKDYAFAETDLGALVRDTIGLVAPVAGERDVAIDCQIEDPDGSRAPVLDSVAIQQALVNLLDNAIKFSPRGGSVGVTLSFPSDTWQLRVSDEGPGIPVADRERVFERFTRLGDELRRETRGTGIGLSLVKHIIEAHGGTVRIVDCDRGGAEFILCASLDPGAASQAQPTST